MVGLSMHKVKSKSIVQNWEPTRRELLARWRSQPMPRSSEWTRVSRSAMACQFEAIFAPECEIAVSVSEEYFRVVDRLESILSIFRPDSEVSVLNCLAAERAVYVGPELLALLELCELLHRETGGAFDVTSGALSKCWGFEARRPSIPSLEALAVARNSSGFHRISFNRQGVVSFLATGLRINFGGIGKGFALDQGAARIRARGIVTALLSAGNSSMLALGDGPDGHGWNVGLRHPIFKNQRIGTVRLHSYALGTSGQEEQSIEIEGLRYGHILDPRSGWPVRSVVSVTVLAHSATEADALATAFFVGGKELAERYCSAHPGIVAIMLLESDLSRPTIIGSSDQVEVNFGNR